MARNLHRLQPEKIYMKHASGYSYKTNTQHNLIKLFKHRQVAYFCSGIFLNGYKIQTITPLTFSTTISSCFFLYEVLLPFTVRKRKMGVMNGEVELNVPASKAWEIFKTNELIKKVNPTFLANAVYVEGDGRPGSVRLFKLGAGVNKYVSESKQRIEEVEEEPGNGVLRMKYEVVEGELKKMYDPYTVTFSFRGDEEKNKCIAGWRAEYQPLSPAVAPPEKAKDVALRFMKAIEDFYISSNFLATNCN